MVCKSTRMSVWKLWIRLCYKIFFQSVETAIACRGVQYEKDNPAKDWQENWDIINEQIIMQYEKYHVYLKQIMKWYRSQFSADDIYTVNVGFGEIHSHFALHPWCWMSVCACSNYRVLKHYIDGIVHSSLQFDPLHF